MDDWAELPFGDVDGNAGDILEVANEGANGWANDADGPIVNENNWLADAGGQEGVDDEGWQGWAAAAAAAAAAVAAVEGDNDAWDTEGEEQGSDGEEGAGDAGDGDAEPEGGDAELEDQAANVVEAGSAGTADTQPAGLTEGELNGDGIAAAGALVPVDGWTAEGVGSMALDVVSMILTNMLPGVQETPAPIRGWGRPPAHWDWVVNAMTASRAWYDTALRTPAIWGALLPAATSHVQWLQFSERARGAGLRLVYEDRATWGRADAVIRRASGLYARSSCPWRDFGAILQGGEMLLLEVVRLRPSEIGKPDALPRARRRPVFAPLLVICEMSSASLFVSSRMERLVASNYWLDQLRDQLEVAPSLRHLEIHKTRSMGRIDWTGLMSVGCWDSLEHLIFWCNAFQSYDLPSDAVAVHAPRLRAVDAGGAVLLRAPRVRRLHYERTSWRDLRRMLKEAPSVQHLSVRVLTNGAGPLANSHTEPGGGAMEVAQLTKLTTLTVENTIGVRTRMLLLGLCTPALREMTLWLDATGPPNRAALEQTSDMLEVAGDMGVDELLNAFWWARVIFARSGYPQLLAELNTMLPAEFGGGAPPGPIVNMLGALRNAAMTLREFVQATAADEPAGPHAAEMLRDVIVAALTATGVVLEGAEAVLTVKLEGNAVRYYVAMEDATGDVRYFTLWLTGPPFPPAPPLEPWSREDSLAGGGARAMAALSILPMVEISVTQSAADPFNGLASASAPDIAELSASLATFTEVDTLRFEIGDEAQSTTLLKAMQAPVLTALTHVFVTREAMGNELTAGRPPSVMGWLEELELALARRAEQGLALEYVNVSGHFCVCMIWERRVRTVVGLLHLNVTCTHRVRSLCVVCDPVPMW